MFSDTIKTALEREVVGQPRAINSVVRGVTRVISGLTPSERSMCAFLFMGPTGTGKSQLIRTLARVLHGDENRVVVADCTHFIQGDPWTAFVSQLAPLFSSSSMHDKYRVAEAPPLSIVRVEYLERGPAELYKALSVALETGQIVLPGGQRGTLRNCLMFFTSGLCAREILEETSRIGFSGALEEGDDDPEQDKISKLCLEQAEKHFSTDFIGRLDAMLIFRRLEEEHLAQVLERRSERLVRWLGQRGFRYELRPAAGSFLLERGTKDMRLGARNLVRAHQRFVEFPVADLLVSGRIPVGGAIVVDCKPGEEHLHFEVTESADLPSHVPPSMHEIPVAWEEPRTP